MAKTQKNDAVWVEVDVNSLGTEDRKAYEAYKEAYRETKAKREAFEASMQGMAPQGKRLIFGYNFGKLSVAVVDAKDAPKAKPAKMSLSEYMRTMASQGRTQ